MSKESRMSTRTFFSEHDDFSFCYIDKIKECYIKGRTLYVVAECGRYREYGERK